MKILKTFDIDTTFQTKIYLKERLKDISIVIFQHGTRFSYGLFDLDTGEKLFLSKKAFLKHEVQIAVIRQLENFI